MAELKIISMDEVQSKEVNWLWYPYIPYGKITIIQGDPGEGKTTLALRLAALLSKGEALPYDDTEREPVKIIYQTAEDGLEDTIKPRLEAAEADCTQIKVIDESEAALSMLDERIEKAIIEVGARVVILDPIQAYVGANINMNNAKPAYTNLITKFKFFFCRMMQKSIHRSDPEYLDGKYWAEQGWLADSRPWK